MIKTHKKSDREIKKIVNERINRHEVKWCRTVYPTNALAQEADMSLTEYREFIFEACKLYSPDPSADWIKEGEF